MNTLIRAASMAMTAFVWFANAVPAHAADDPVPGKKSPLEEFNRALKTRIDVIAKDEPLRKLLQRLADEHKVAIRFNDAAIRAAGVAVDRPTTLTLRNFTLQQSLDRILSRSGLRYSVTDAMILVGPIPPPPQQPARPLIALFQSMDETQLADMVRAKSEQNLQRKLAVVSQSPGVSDDQVSKLELAGKGDIQRLVRRVVQLRQQFEAIRRGRDPVKTSNYVLELQQLQREVDSGPFDESSFFAKTLNMVRNEGP